ncbi:hypothetical protein [Streptomyces cylindrosporus]|uniref:Scaffolding protein n=1 Tax=Streptomyces cylindrosporus TaxID=2927583 RepID=A0ABS9YQX0_9ACTN|nr:hypothetical protein [Streptomyces cylindrosporus]MCI3279101.1 hypothetical protein [Streptomyces cylindrosporus]
MRRPAQQPYGPVASTAWTHPYRGIRGLGVFYNSGTPGTDPSTPPAVPSPAELAARAGQQPPATPPAPAVPPAPATDPAEVKVEFTQRRLNKIMADEKEEGRRAAFRTVAEAAGIDPDSFDPAQFGDIFKQAEQARQQQLSEEQRRLEEVERREQAIQAREDAAAAKEKAAQDRDRASRIRAALVTLGATGADLEDAAALLRVPDDASDDDITKAAEELKGRRKEMFGAAPDPQTLPPAPSGGPAGGNAPRTPSSSKDAVRDAARERAERMGLRRTA